MARPKSDPTQTPTRERILAAARERFAEVGFAAAGLAEIARQAGITRPSLLYHFASKDALYEATVREAFGALRAALESALAQTVGDDVPALVQDLVRAYVAFLDAAPWFAPLLVREVLDGRGPGRDLIEREVLPVLDWLEATLDHADARPPVPLRAAILHTATAALMRASAGPLRVSLWGEDEVFPALTAAMLTPRAPKERSP